LLLPQLHLLLLEQWERWRLLGLFVMQDAWVHVGCSSCCTSWQQWLLPLRLLLLVLLTTWWWLLLFVVLLLLW
jgi:hypothetical protein